MNCFSNVAMSLISQLFTQAGQIWWTNSKGEQKITDLQHAIQLDKEQWSYHKLLAETVH